MKRLLPWLLCILPTGVALAQEDVAPPSGRVVEEEPAAPPAAEPDALPPRSDDSETRQVMGADNATKPRRAPPPRPAPKPTAKVLRDKDGKVVTPKAPEPLVDPLAPKSSRMTGVDRAWLSMQQVVASMLLGGAPMLLCTLCACPPLAFISVLNPLIGLAVTGGCFGVLAPLHVLLSSVGLFGPAFFRDGGDYLAAGTAAAAIFLVDTLALVVGGITSVAVLLRWANSPSDPGNPIRAPTILTEGLPKLPGMTGGAFALLLNVAAASAVVVFVAPLVGLLAYAAVILVRDEPAPAAEQTPAPTPKEAPPATRRRRVRRTS